MARRPAQMVRRRVHMDRRRNDRGVPTGRLKSAMTVLRVRAQFAERALSGRRFGVFGKREAGLGIPVKASSAAVAALAVMMVPPAAAAQPATAAPAPQAAGSAPGMPRSIYTPWVKFCGKNKDAQAKQVCFTGKDARTEAGQPLVAAALIEPEGEPNRLFRITLPNPLQLQYGTRVIVDQQPPMTAPFITCLARGCTADYEATPDLIAKLKHGRMLTIQAINVAGAALSFPLPLVDFAKANEGRPTDPKVFEEQQQPQQQEKKLQDELQRRADEALKKVESQKLRDELQKRADEARKKLESQGGAAPAPSR
jgi:invasion protein IalB